MDLIEFVYERFTEYLYPKLVSDIVDEMDLLHKAQDPPYSKGILCIEIHRGLTARKWSNYYLRRITEPAIT